MKPSGPYASPPPVVASARNTKRELERQSAHKVFDLLEARTKESLIAERTGLPETTIQRLSSAKRLFESGLNLEDRSAWPKNLLAAWPLLLPTVHRWWEKWRSHGDVPSVGMRTSHMDVLTALALRVRDDLAPPSRSWLLIIGPPCWPSRLSPTRASEPPKYLFEDHDEFRWLAVHVPELTHRLGVVYGAFTAYVSKFETLKITVSRMLVDVLPGLSPGVALEALKDAIIYEAIDLELDPRAPVREPRIEPGDRSGTQTVRMTGRAAPNLRPSVARKAADLFPNQVKRTLTLQEFLSAADGYRELNGALERARALVGSESQIRRALLERNCASCRPPLDRLPAAGSSM